MSNVRQVPDRDGGTMPYNPDMVGEDFEPNPMMARVKWDEWWCVCGHLVVDHHCRADFPETHLMHCWAVGCECRVGVG